MAEKEQKQIKELKEKVEIQKQQIVEQKKLTLSAIHLAKQAARTFTSETKKQVVTALVAAFGFLIALVWRDAISAYVKNLVDTSSAITNPNLALLYTAIITTIIAVIGIILVNRWGKKE